MHSNDGDGMSTAVTRGHSRQRLGCTKQSARQLVPAGSVSTAETHYARRTTQERTQSAASRHEHARSGTARNIDSEQATLSIESRRTDTLRRAVRKDDQRTLMLDVTERQGSQQSKRERSTRPMRAKCDPHRHHPEIGLPIVGALTFCPLVLISY